MCVASLLLITTDGTPASVWNDLHPTAAFIDSFTKSTLSLARSVSDFNVALSFLAKSGESSVRGSASNNIDNCNDDHALLSSRLGVGIHLQMLINKLTDVLLSNESIGTLPSLEHTTSCCPGVKLGAVFTALVTRNEVDGLIFVTMQMGLHFAKRAHPRPLVPAHHAQQVDRSTC